MKICKNCGRNLPDEAKFCRECGCEVTPEEPINEKETQFCSKCGSEMPKGTRFCPNCGTPSGIPQPMNFSPVKRHSPVLAAILSFFITGLGQLYIGLTKKGIILFVGLVISSILTIIMIGWIFWLFIWFYGIYDAYNSAEKMNNGIAVEDTLDFNNLF